MRYVDKSRMILFVGGVTLLLLSFSIETEAAMTIEKHAFGNTPDGTPVDLYTLTNDNGIDVKITTYEGIVVSIFAPDRNGNLEDVVLGYDTLEGYIKHDPYFGGIKDRDTQRFNNVVWEAKEFSHEEEVGVRLSTISEHKKNAGKLSVIVSYTLTNDNELKIEYTVTTTRETSVNITNQLYFNLAGEEPRDILDHELLINGESFYPMDEHTLRPVYKLRGRVLGTSMDYTQPTTIGPRLKNQADEQIRLMGGYHHLWELNQSGEHLTLAARVYEPTTKRVLEVQTTASRMWFETGNFLDLPITGKWDRIYNRHSGFTLEAQHLTGPVDEAIFPSIVLKPDQTYNYTIVYKFFAL
jgi:aldose 1-epimerase